MIVGFPLVDIWLIGELRGKRKGFFLEDLRVRISFELFPCIGLSIQLLYLPPID